MNNRAISMFVSELRAAGRIVLKAFLWAVPGAVALVLLAIWMTSPERIATFDLYPWTVDVYAEAEFNYEPPGYISFYLKKWGRTHAPGRWFMVVGPERKPSGPFKLVATDDGEIIAIVLNNQIQMIHEFSSGYTWPGPYTNVTEPQWEMAELLLPRLIADNPGLSCPRQAEYRGELDRRRQLDWE